MKKLLFSLVVSAIALVALVSCKDNFEETNQNPVPVPIEKKMVLNLNIDFPSFESVTDFYVAPIVSREGLEYTTGNTFINTDWQGQELKQNFSVVLPSSLDSLRGKTCEMIFMVDYMYEGMQWTAEIIRNVTFSDTDTTNLGNVGFSNYEWRTHPPLLLVIVPDNIKHYASN